MTGDRHLRARPASWAKGSTVSPCAMYRSLPRRAMALAIRLLVGTAVVVALAVAALLFWDWREMR